MTLLFSALGFLEVSLHSPSSGIAPLCGSIDARTRGPRVRKCEPVYSEDKIQELYAALESETIERKEAYANAADAIRNAICAFANDLPNHRRPGVIFVGQRDDGTCANLNIDDGLLQQIGGLRSDGKIQPLPVMSVTRQTIAGCTVAVIQVTPSERPPVRVDGRTWIRVGARRAIATVEEERRLTEKQVWHNIPFDMRPFIGAKIDDLDINRFELEYVPAANSPEILRQNGRQTTEKLRALRLTDPTGTPTAAALLLLGQEPRQFLPGAYVQFLKLDGTTLTSPIKSQKEIGGTVPDQIRQLEELVRLNVTTSATIAGPVRNERSDYPMAALEQLLRNALLHRNYDASTAPVRVTWYSDRIEIQSPGGLYGEVTPESIWHNATSYRNPALAEGLKALGLVERFGFGLVKAQQALEENGNPVLESEFLANHVLFTLMPAR